jgi:REP element-mobilizing transposase RayT
MPHIGDMSACHHRRHSGGASLQPQAFLAATTFEVLRIGHLARTYGERKRNFVGQNFWARGYFVSTVGRDEAAIREYIKNQEQEDKRLDQMNLWR